MTRHFKGGKGVATAGGMLAVLFPVIVVILAVVWFVIARVFKLASVGSLIVAVLFPVRGVARWATPGGRSRSPGRSRCSWSLRHLPNLRRLVKGQELRT